MKKILIALFIVFFATVTDAQEIKNRHAISLEYGVSMPTGMYRNNNVKNEEAGFAKSGFTSAFSYSYNFLPNVKALFSSYSYTNIFDLDAYAQNWANFLGSGSSIGTIVVSAESSSYRVGALLTGLAYSFPIVENLSFEPRAMIGLGFGVLPNLYEKIYAYGQLAYMSNRQESTTVYLSHLIGASVKYSFNNKYFTKFNIDYVGGRAKWENVRNIELLTSPKSYTVFYEDFAMNLSAININLSFGLRF
jgi:hypothetical protein